MMSVLLKSSTTSYGPPNLVTGSIESQTSKSAKGLPDNLFSYNIRERNYTLSLWILTSIV